MKGLRKRHKSQTERWEHWFCLAEKYYDEHGDLLVPRTYSTEQGEKLGRWIERQRMNYGQGRSVLMDDNRVGRLEQIGMVWQLEVRTDWAVWIELCEDYYSRNSHLKVPKTYIVDGLGLGEWLSFQRRMRQKNELSEEQIAQLDSVGMIWKVNDRRAWDDWFSHAEQYYQKFGHLDIPLEYVTEDGWKLGRWICIQRDRYYKALEPDRHGKRTPITPEQITRLSSISMNWKQYYKNAQHKVVANETL